MMEHNPHPIITHPSEAKSCTFSTTPPAVLNPSTPVHENERHINGYVDHSFSDGGAQPEQLGGEDTAEGGRWRRRWAHFAAAGIVVLFLGSCGGGVLSGLLFKGIGEVQGLQGQWIAQGLVMFASLTSLLYIVLHIRAARLGPLLHISPTSTSSSLLSSDHQTFIPPFPPSWPFKHALYAHAVLAIRAAVLLWAAAAMPAVAMAVYHGGRSVLRLDLFVCVVGLLSTSLLVFIVHRVPDPFELPGVSPAYLVRGGGGVSSGMEAGLRGGGGSGKNSLKRKKRKKKKGKSGGSLSFSSSSGGSSWSSSTRASSRSASTHPSGSPKRGRNPQPSAPAPVYTGKVAGPRAYPGNNRRVLARLSTINLDVGPAPHAAGGGGGGAPAEKGTSPAASSIGGSIAAGVTGWIWGRGNGEGSQSQESNGSGGGGVKAGGKRPPPAYVEDCDEDDERGQISGVGKGNMPGTYHWEDYPRGWEAR